MEVWKNIKGYENIYQVSNLGNVRRIYANKKTKILRPSLNKSGYLYVCICEKGKKKLFRVHKLVALAFLGDIPDNLEINHINGIKTDNRKDNLEYVSRSYNLIHAYENELEKRQFNNEKKSKIVYQYDLNNNFIKAWESLCEIQRQLKFAKTNISKCCNKKIHTAYGYRWTFVERKCLS